MVEQDVIGHLIDVERLASDLLLDAQAEADRRKAEAKEKAEREFLSRYEELVGELSASYDAGRASCDAAKEREFSQYAERLSSVTKDQSALNRYLDSVFFGQ